MADKETRSEQIQIRLTPTERQKIEVLSRSDSEFANNTISGWILQAIREKIAGSPGRTPKGK